MSEDEFVDPGEPGELKALMRAKDLLNKPCLFRPNGIGQGTNKEGEIYEFVECDVWVLDRAGIIEEGTGVQVSWVRVQPQLIDRLGSFVAATPRRQDDNSVVLQPFSEAGRAIARTAMQEIKARPEPKEAAPSGDDDYPDGEEPF